MKMTLRAAAVIAAVNLMANACVFAQVVVQPSRAAGSSGSSSGRTSASVIVPARRGFDFSSFGGSGAGPALVVPAGEISIGDLAAANEDMTVMARILQDALRKADLADSGPNPIVVATINPTANTLCVQRRETDFILFPFGIWEPKKIHAMSPSLIPFQRKPHFRRYPRRGLTHRGD